MSRLSNFYVPGRSSRLIMRESIKLLDKPRVMEEIKGDNEDNFLSLAGIADAARKNTEYQSLLSQLEINDLSFNELYLITERFLLDKYNSDEIKEQVGYADITHNLENRKAWVNFSDVNPRIILLWKQNKYSIKSIALIMNTSKEQVNKWIAKYKRGVKKIWKMKQRVNWRKKKRISNDYIESIREYCNLQKNQPITIKKIKSYVHNSGSSVEQSSHTTIRSILRKELKMNYKILHKCHKKVMTNDYTFLIAESLSIQLKLMSIHYEVIYLDEFSFSSRK